MVSTKDGTSCNYYIENFQFDNVPVIFTSSFRRRSYFVGLLRFLPVCLTDGLEYGFDGFHDSAMRGCSLRDNGSKWRIWWIRIFNGAGFWCWGGFWLGFRALCWQCGKLYNGSFLLTLYSSSKKGERRCWIQVARLQWVSWTGI